MFFAALTFGQLAIYAMAFLLGLIGFFLVAMTIVILAVFTRAAINGEFTKQIKKVGKNGRKQ